jgi:hypothetical protein
VVLLTALERYAGAAGKEHPGALARPAPVQEVALQPSSGRPAATSFALRLWTIIGRFQ